MGESTYNNILWIVLGAVLFFLYQNMQMNKKYVWQSHIGLTKTFTKFSSAAFGKFPPLNGAESKLEGVKQFQDFMENESDKQEGDFVIYDKLSDWRNWLQKKEVIFVFSSFLNTFKISFLP